MTYGDLSLSNTFGNCIFVVLNDYIFSNNAQKFHPLYVHKSCNTSRKEHGHYHANPKHRHLIDPIKSTDTEPNNILIARYLRNPEILLATNPIPCYKRTMVTLC